MRKKTSPTIVEQAIIMVPEFEYVFKKLKQQVKLKGQSESTFSNYVRQIVIFALHFQRLPEYTSEDEINEFLASKASDPKSPSRSTFKHMMYGLRYYYCLLGMK